VISLKDGNDVDAIAAALKAAKEDDRPTLIICPTRIGFGCPAKEGKASAHGEPLGVDNLIETKKNLGMPEENFVVLPEVYEHCKALMEKNEQAEAEWNALFAAYAKEYPELAEEWEAWHSEELPDEVMMGDDLWKWDGKDATRNCSGAMINKLAKLLPNLVGGSADLAPSNKSNIKDGGDYSAENRAGRNLHFGVREHAMAAICNAMALHGGLRVFCATFFVFSDYMKHAMRMSAIMKLPVTYVLTHDSIGVGEDGATHQPIEQLAGLRSIPDSLIFRPADGRETTAAWLTALTSGLPTSLVLTRQNLPLYENSSCNAMKGGYILSDSEKETPDILLMASGSEVEQVMGAQAELKKEGIDARVISIPCMELFLKQDKEYQESVIPSAVRARVSMEAGVTMPWYRFVGLDGKALGIDHFGASAPAAVLFKEYGFTVENVVAAAKELLGK